MKITATYITGYEFGIGSKPTYGTKVFSNSVDYREWMKEMEEWDEADLVVSVVYDC